MNLKELEHAIETAETQIQNCARGNDALFMQGILARGCWEVARQLAILTETVKTSSSNLYDTSFEPPYDN